MSIKKNSKVAKATSAFVGFTTAVMMLGSVAVLPASAATVDDLLAQIVALTAQLNALKGTTTTVTSLSGVTFSKNLSLGMTSADVKNLQMVLNAKAETQVALSGAGSPGHETTFFGPATKKAVVKFQELYSADILAPVGLSRGTGSVGPSTRAKLNTITSSTTTTTTTTTTGGTTTTTGGTTTTTTGTGLTVGTATQPSNGLAPTSAARVPFTKFTLTAGNDGDVTVNSFVVERGGPASDAVFNGVVVLDDNGIQIGDQKTFNSDHRLTVGNAVKIPRGTTRTFTLAGNMASNLVNFAGQVAALSLVQVNTSATVTGTLPVTGAAHTINASLSIGSATAAVSSFDPNASLNKEIGTTGYRFAGVRVQAGSAEKIRLTSVRWNQTGSVGSSDLANVVTVVDGTSYPTTISADGKYWVSSFGSGILIDKGFSKDITIQGDIMGSNSSGRTVQFDLFQNTDVYLTGETFGYGVTVTAQQTGAASTASEFTTGTPFFSGSVTNVTAGSVTTIVKSASVASQNIAVNVPDQPLGGFDITIKGEPITVQSMVFTVATSSGSGTGLLTNVSLVDQNGKVVAGPVDATDPTVTDGNQTLTFTDTVTFPLGAGTYTLKGRLPSTTGNNQTVVVSTNPATGWTNVKGQNSGNTISLSGNTSFAMNTMTVKGANLIISVAASPVAQSIVAGGSARLFANYQFDASQSGEDLRFASIPLQLTFNTNSAAATDLTNCLLYNAAGQALNTSNPVNPSGTTPASATFTLDAPYVVPKGTVKTLSLKCTVGTSATGRKYSWGIAASPSISVTGVTSSSDVSETVIASTGQLQTIAGGTLTVQLDSSSPTYSVASGGSTGVTLGVLKLRAANEAINLQRLALQMSNAAASSSPRNLTQVTIWDGTTQVGAATFTGTSRFATTTFSTPVSLPKDTDKTLTIKGDLATINQSGDGTEGALIQVDYDGSDSTGTQGSGVESGAQINQSSSSDTAVSGVRVYRSFPVFTYSTATGSANNGATDNELLLLNVQADSKGDVQLRKLTFSVATTTALVSAPLFNGPTGSVGTVSLSACTGSPCNITVTFDSSSNTQDRTIAAGQSKTYRLLATVSLTGTNTTGAVATSLKADAEQGASGITGELMGNITDLASSNIIWSPNSTGTSAITANDWQNGFGLSGCFIISGLGQNCQSHTISR